MAKIGFLNIKGRRVFPVTISEAVIVKKGNDGEKPYTLKTKLFEVDESINLVNNSISQINQELNSVKSDIENLKDSSNNMIRIEDQNIEQIFIKEEE